ncbi:MAG: amino acid adenylation domain-containing protein, partial [bacterium]|nr:amino acid adenylation domain-containing protein [bacterium]
TNFVEAGMTSITAMKFSATIYKKFNFEIKSSTLLGECNIFQVENMIQEYLLNNPNSDTQNDEENNTDNENEFELSQNQMGIYYETLKNPTTTVYNIPLELTLDKKIDTEKLKLAFEKTLNNHEIIASYLKQEDEKILLVKNNASSKIDIEEMKEAEYQEFRKSFSKPFDLFKFPLYKGLIVKTECNIYLLFDIHHILFDGISEGIFVNELINNYYGKSTEKEDMSYFEFIKQEKQLEKSEKYQEAENFFNNLLQKFDSATELKSDVKEKETSKLIEYIKPVNTKKVKDFCNKNNFTAAQLFLAASSYALSRFTNTKDIFISTISNGRSNPKLQNTFGMFVKTLPLNVEIKNGKSVKDFISDTGKMFREVINNEIYPYTKISKNFGFMPKIVYACQLGVISNTEIEGTEVKSNSLGLDTPKFPLSIHIEENQAQEIVINLQYDSAIYTNDIISKLANAIDIVLSNMIDFSDKNIEKISMLSEEEENKLKSFRYSAKKELEIDLFHKLFEKSVDTTPDKTALIATDGEYTYKELDKYSNIIANSLIEKGVKIEDKIAILLPRTSNIFKSIFGVLKSGAAYIPCDIEYPQERIEQILEDSDAKYIITNKSHLSLYEKALDIEDLLNSNNDKRPNIDVKPNNLAYMIYTSGSTGKPKGVMIEHKGICNYVNPHKENRHVNALVEDAEIMLSITTISFDMALKEVATSLCNSKTLVFANEEETKNIIELTKLFKRTHADAFNSTPSRMQQFLEWEDFAQNLKNCKVIMCGAENYPMNLYKKLKSLTNARLFNTYGPTEITVSSNCLELTNGVDQVTIGKPLLNYEEFIVDSDGNELPTGVVGELYISGYGVARGYKNLEEQTKEKFIDFNGKKVYKSGDFAKWADNGEVVILGRMDNQVKLRGLRIELDEIQKAVYDFKGIKNSIVVVKKINNVENLCAYFEAEEKIDIDALKDNLQNKLPAYMIPAAFMQMDKLPTTRNGKIDKKNLPDIVVEKEIKTNDYTNKTEQDFCEIFAKILNLDVVSINDSFFDIGGSSLVATRVIIEAKKLDYNITYGDVFAEKTPKNLAKLFNKEISTENDSEFSNYDYSKINEVLAQNTIENFVSKEKQELGDVVITGVTGFLGIHTLVEFIKNETGKVYCLIRKGEFEKPEDRLKALLFYYFDNDFEDLFKDRVVVINGDITNKDSFKEFDKYNINTFINCAANVKHFSEKNDIEEVNYYGVLNIIDYCTKRNINLIQVSTMSIGGFNVDNKSSITSLKENMLFFNQYLSGKYVISKFKAERAVLEAITKGLNAKIMRVGNLSARDTDGEFQINYNTNSFVGRLKAFKVIKKFPYSLINMNAEFSPIDTVAKAILLLAKAPKECCVFHPFNNHGIFMGDIIATMQDRGMKIDFAEQNNFENAVKIAQENKENSAILSSLIAYQNM